jgi:integrase
MTGPARSLLCRVALESGLRAGELRTLAVGACKLDEAPPVLIVEAGYSKHRREDRQPIPRELADALRQHIKGRLAEESVFPGMPQTHSTAKMLRADLATAGVPYRDAGGRVADFHSLRHTYITNLARGGVHPKAAMDLARHSDINLTMARYSHTLLADRAEALSALPDLGEEDGTREAQRATGTYDGGSETARFA